MTPPYDPDPRYVESDETPEPRRGVLTVGLALVASAVVITVILIWLHK